MRGTGLFVRFTIAGIEYVKEALKVSSRTITVDMKEELDTLHCKRYIPIDRVTIDRKKTFEAFASRM